MKTSVSLVLVAFAWLSFSGSALQSAAQLRIDSEEGTVEGTEAGSGIQEGPEEETEGTKDVDPLYKIWYDTEMSRNEPTVHEEHDIPASELEYNAHNADPQTQIIGGDAAIDKASGLEEEADIPGGIIFGDQESSQNASKGEEDPNAVTEKVTMQNETDQTEGGSQLSLDDNAVYGVDEFAEPQKPKPVETEMPDAAAAEAEAEQVAKKASERKAGRALAVLLGKQDGSDAISAEKADKKESPATKEASEKKAEEALAVLLGKPGQAEQAVASAVSKPNDMSWDTAQKTLDRSLAALYLWKPSKLLYDFCNLSRTALLFLGVAFVIMATGTLDFLVFRRCKHHGSACEITGTQALEDYSGQNLPCMSGPLNEENAEGSKEDLPIDTLEAMHASADEEQAVVSKEEAVVSKDELLKSKEEAPASKEQAQFLKQKAALTGTSWLSRRMGLICFAR